MSGERGRAAEVTSAIEEDVAPPEKKGRTDLGPVVTRGGDVDERAYLRENRPRSIKELVLSKRASKRKDLPPETSPVSDADARTYAKAGFEARYPGVAPGSEEGRKALQGLVDESRKQLVLPEAGQPTEPEAEPELEKKFDDAMKEVGGPPTVLGAGSPENETLEQKRKRLMYNYGVRTV